MIGYPFENRFKNKQNEIDVRIENEKFTKVLNNITNMYLQMI